MKAIKKVFGLILALTMLMGLSVAAFATDITISGGTSGSQYAAYKLMDATDGDNGKFAYTVNSKYSSALQEVSGQSTDAEVIKYISALDAAQTREFADSVYKKIKSETPEYITSTDTFENVNQGYYLIAETTVGSDQDTYSLVILDTAGKDNITVTTKEDTPELEKKVQEKNDSTGTTSDWQDGADYDIGDTVPFQLTGTVSEKIADYDTYAYTFHDKMSDGLTLNKDSIVVKVDGTTVDSSKYTIVYTEGAKQNDDCTFEVKFADLKACGVPVTATSKVTVEFNATLNSNAVIGSVGNPNVAYLEYDNNPYGEGTGKTPEDKVIVFTYKLVANKVDKDGNALAGAGFTLYKFDSENNDYVQVGDEITGTTTFAFNGLDAGKYKLVETTVPAGYNKAEDLEFEVVATYDTNSADPKLISLEIKSLDGAVISGEGKVFTTNLAAGSATTDVKNLSGTELPSTGGIGTTIFYVIGGIMVGGAAILLITKKRMNGKAE